MPAAKKSPKPFANLTAAMNAFDAHDIRSDLDMLSEDADDDETTAAIATAVDAIKTAECVETMADFVANLQEAAEALRPITDAVSVTAEIDRVLARCAA